MRDVRGMGGGSCYSVKHNITERDNTEGQDDTKTTQHCHCTVHEILKVNNT